MKANLATSLIAYARGGVRKQLLVLCLLTLCAGNTWASAYLKGAWDSWVNHDISGGSCEITLDANTEYEFGIDVDGSFYSYSNQNFTTTSTSFQIYTGNGNCKITTGEAGTYIFKTWYDNGRYMAVYYPQARLTKQKYIYFDVRNQTNWNSADFDARFWFKYYDSGVDNGSVDCNKGNALENWVYYALVPDHDYIGQIQMNRLNPSNHDDIWCTANIAYAKDRTSSAQNCLKEESGKANYCIYWTPQWTTYCPPMTSVTLADNGTTNWGGNGSSSTPYLVPTGGDIKVHVTASASALDDANMTKYFLFKKEGSAVGEGSSSTEKTITASGTTGTKEAVTVDAYNYYNSTEGTHLTSSAIYYEARTPYTISYNAGTGGSGSRASETKLKGVNFTLPNSAVFERTGYTQTGWTTSNLGAQTHAFGASYSSDAAQTFYPVWSENEYNITINVAGSGTTSPPSSTIGKIETPSEDITATPGTGYSFREWDFSKQGESDYDVWCAAGYTSTNATIRISAKRDGTLTAKFTANNYTVGLDNREADPEHGGTASVNVTYDATTGLTSAITPPQKEHYTFGGYYISTDRGATLTNIQLIDASGNWNTGVSGYIDGSKRWICAGDTMLYAQWTENLYSVTVTAGANGSVSPSSVSNIGYVTASGDITATADPGYHFVSWTLPANVPTAYSYIATSNPIRIRATASGQTITANFAATNYTVTLDNREPTTSGTTSVSVTYNATTNLTSDITPPQKEHYIFGGYFTEVGGAGTQLINADGSWIKDVTGYTSHDGDNPKWVLADDLTLYAKWTETMYPVAIAISPAGAGNVQVSGETVTEVTAGYATHSPEMTAVPANAAWVFKEWQVSSASLSMDLEHYSTTGTSMQVISVAADQTLTAVFEPRFYLVGGEITGTGDGGSGTESGMPGWDNYNEPFEIVTNSPILATCSLTLGSNKNFYIMVRDKTDGLSYGKSSSTLGDESIAEPITFTDQDNKVLFYSNGGRNYTFKITAVDGSGRPIVSVERPHQMHFAHKRVDIDGNDYNDDLGGTLTATINDESAAHEQWFDYGSDVNWTATAETGYSLTWYTDNAYSNAMNPQPAASWSDPDITHDENIFAKFTEKATTVTLSNDGHGKVQIGGVDKTSTTCGVTTTRELTAVPNEGYKFSSWSKSGDDITLSSTSTNPTTLSGNGSGATSGQTVTANFVERYSIKGTMNGENWGTTHTLSNIGTNAGSKDTCYVTMTLPANTTYEFAIYDEQTKGWLKNSTTEVFKMTYGNSSAWPFDTDKTVNCGITTAGRGTYKFIFNITDKTVTVVYPTSYQVNYGAAIGGSVTSVLDDDGNMVPNGGYVRKGGSVTYEATASDGYTFTGWCPDDSYGDIFTDHNPWENSSITATSNAYAKFHSTNFVIYRTDDKSSDPRAVWDDVESYEGGTISETIEFRMKVNKLDFWYTLCLPFEVNAVRVWEDGEYYDIVPYWRPTDSTYCTGHYILRRPVTTTDFAIEGFEGKDRWIDPKSSDVLPSKNIPYIIQWHVDYFQGKYISFFGTAGQTIPTAMDKGNYASSDETVNIYGNNSMTIGTVRDAYLLDPYYGSDGAWMREEIGTDRRVLPFECFILANPATTAKYRVLRRDMADDTPTGLDTLSMTEDSVSKVMINNRIYIIRGGKMYTIQGTFVKEVE